MVILRSVINARLSQVKLLAFPMLFVLTVLASAVPRASAALPSAMLTITAREHSAASTTMLTITASEPSAASTTMPQPCQAVAGKSALQLALRHYIKAAVPLPRRFLVAAGTDSGMSDAAMKTLIEFGPSYYYTGSEAAKAKLRDKLTTVGPWPVLLIVLRSDKKIRTTTEVIRLGGHYVTGEFDGQHAISREYTMSCGAAGWTVKDVKEEKGA